jgi:hypothetical protein
MICMILRSDGLRAVTKELLMSFSNASRSEKIGCWRVSNSTRTDKAQMPLFQFSSSCLLHELCHPLEPLPKLVNGNRTGDEAPTINPSLCVAAGRIQSLRASCSAVAIPVALCWRFLPDLCCRRVTLAVS